MRKVSVSLVNATVLCTTFVSTLCLVLCFKNEGDHQRLSSSLNLKDNLDHSLWQPVNDRAALRELFEMYRDADPIWKRAPAAGFYGVRGKKVPGQNFFGMRGKKGPSGFLGMRGKKMVGGLQQQSLSDQFEGMEPLDAELNDLWTSKELPHGMDNGKQLQQQQQQQQLRQQLLGGGGGDNLSMDDHTDSKRVPADGFMGLRGKRSPKGSSASSSASAATVSHHALH